MELSINECHAVNDAGGADIADGYSGFKNTWAPEGRSRRGSMASLKTFLMRLGSLSTALDIVFCCVKCIPDNNAVKKQC